MYTRKYYITSSLLFYSSSSRPPATHPPPDLQLLQDEDPSPMYLFLHVLEVQSAILKSLFPLVFNIITLPCTFCWQMQWKFSEFLTLQQVSLAFFLL